MSFAILQKISFFSKDLKIKFNLFPLPEIGRRSTFGTVQDVMYVIPF